MNPIVSSDPSTYKIHYKDHSIPNTAVSASHGDSIFYFHSQAVHSYSLSTGKHKRLFPLKSSSVLILLRGSFICSVSGSVLSIANFSPTSGSLSSNLHEVPLKDVPLQVLQFTDRNSHFIGFLHPDSLEIFKLKEAAPRSVPGTLTAIRLPFRARGMACTAASTYFLTEAGSILRCSNIFIAQCMTLTARMHGTSGDFTGIYSAGEAILLRSGTTVSRYETTGEALVLQYSLETQSRDDEVVLGFLLGNRLVQLGRAPFMILNERISHLTEGMAVGAGRVYFIERGSEEAEYRPTYEMRDYRTTINPECIKVPEVVKDKGQREGYLRNALALKKFEAVLKTLQRISSDLSEREEQSNEEYGEIMKAVEAVDERRRKLEARVNEIRERAERVKFNGELSGFYEKIGELEKRLGSLAVGRFEEHKKKLRGQRAVLNEKYIC